MKCLEELYYSYFVSPGCVVKHEKISILDILYLLHLQKAFKQGQNGRKVWKKLSRSVSVSMWSEMNR